MVLKRFLLCYPHILMFENDVEMYGAQTNVIEQQSPFEFENDVEMYGAQTVQYFSRRGTWFENDVEMYGAQTCVIVR